MYGDGVPGPGDLGRRVTARRRELGLSREQLAVLAGMSVAYLAYLETRPASPTLGCVIRLADALQTTPDELLGAGSAGPHVPAAQGAPA
jgi:transcriptional regulator with XRE-family HTH domain